MVRSLKCFTISSWFYLSCYFLFNIMNLLLVGKQEGKLVWNVDRVFQPNTCLTSLSFSPPPPPPNSCLPGVGCLVEILLSRQLSWFLTTDMRRITARTCVLLKNIIHFILCVIEYDHLSVNATSILIDQGLRGESLQKVYNFLRSRMEEVKLHPIYRILMVRTFEQISLIWN